MNGNAQFVAGGNISPSRFVKIDTGADNTVVMAEAGGAAIGISQAGERNVPYSTLDDGYCAIAGEPLRVFQLGEIAPLELGGSVTRGARLKSDSNSKGVTAAATDPAYAIALQSGADGAVIDVMVVYQGIAAAA